MTPVVWQQQPVSPALPALGDAAVRDTIAAIARGAEYQRELTSSIGSRILRWIGDVLDDFFKAIANTEHGRAITIGALILVGALIAARIVIGIRAERAMHGARSVRRPTSASTAALLDAERLAAAGNFTAAAHALFAALLATFAARGEVRLHDSKTTGDYARELRRRSSSALPPFQAFRSRYDRVIYGDMQCSAGDYYALALDARQALGQERAA